MNTSEQIHEAYRNSRNYPELVQMLIDAGVQSYTVDVSSDIKLYRLADHSTILHNDKSATRLVAQQFDASKVADCIVATQAMQMTYEQFMPAIAAAGVRFYDAVLVGDNKRVNYIGIGGNVEEKMPF
ncbi:MAG: DUF1398 family protein [Chitinophagaceae bacterium]|nr:DUF1398 family protein [Chitinophagaceae bacterium]